MGQENAHLCTHFYYYYFLAATLINCNTVVSIGINKVQLLEEIKNCNYTTVCCPTLTQAGIPGKEAK